MIACPVCDECLEYRPPERPAEDVLAAHMVGVHGVPTGFMDPPDKSAPEPAEKEA